MQYLLVMQIKRKWQRQPLDIEPGTVVVLGDLHLPRSPWQIGSVIKVFSWVTAVKQPIAHLIVLPKIPDEDEPPKRRDCNQTVSMTQFPTKQIYIN